VLHGDAQLVGLTVNACPFQRRYVSCVLSFAREDVDGTLISATGTSQDAVRLMVLEAKAKGWSAVTISGSEAFRDAMAREAVRQGLSVVNADLAAVAEDEMRRMATAANEPALSRTKWFTIPPAKRRRTTMTAALLLTVG
jgi:hypothetical protein